MRIAQAERYTYMKFNIEFRGWMLLFVFRFSSKRWGEFFKELGHDQEEVGQEDFGYDQEDR